MTKIAVDIVMTAMMVLLMTYEMISQALHEWLGIGMFVLLIIHHVLNRQWIQNIFKGRYTAVRILQTAFVIGILLTTLGSMVSGVMLSQTVFSFLPIQGGSFFAHKLHMVCAYSGYILISMHFGFHWGIMISIIKKHLQKKQVQLVWGLRLAAFLFAGYGAFAFAKRNIGQYMLLKYHFVFFDFAEPLVYFLFDYFAVMALFIWIGHYLAVFLKWYGRKEERFRAE